MANEKHVALLQQGITGWNVWRNKHRDIKPALRGADLVGAELGGALLVRADLRGANLRGAALRGAVLHEADLTGADLTGALLFGANLREANLRGAVLHGADLTMALLFETLFVNVNLTSARGLDLCMHVGPSTIDHRTLEQSGPLPLSFLRGCGLPERLINYLPSILEQAIRFYSCFISYSSKDEAFARRLHADLQDKGVRCWFAPHDMPIGAKILDAIDEAIRLRDKVLLILSEASIASDWVEGEVTRALDEERERKRTVLFPIRLDDAVLGTEEAWTVKLRDGRHIGDFRCWKEHDAYRKALDRLLRGLRVETAGSP